MSTYDENIMTTEDKAKLKTAQEAYKKALAAGDKNGMASAHQRAEAIRKAYGYTGGSDGSGYTQLEGYEGAEDLQKAGEDLKTAYSGVADVYKKRAETQKKDIDVQTDDMLRQAYISNMQGQKGIDQQLRASGVTGGLSETTRAGLQQNYENNRISAQKAAVETKKDIDMDTTSALAQNELNRANAQYSTDVNKAQFQQTAAEANRNVDLNKEQLDLSKQQQDMSKYLTFIQSGLVDKNNSKDIAKALGISESALLRASKAAQNADDASVALSLLSAGVYDDSFVDILGGRFSADTLKKYVNIVKSNFNKSSGGGRSSSGASSSYGNIPEVDEDLNQNDMFESIQNNPPDEKTIEGTNALAELVRKNDYGKNFTADDWQALAAALGADVVSAQNAVKVIKNLDGVV